MKRGHNIGSSLDKIKEICRGMRSVVKNYYTKNMEWEMDTSGVSL